MRHSKINGRMSAMGHRLPRRLNLRRPLCPWGASCMSANGGKADAVAVSGRGSQ